MKPPYIVDGRHRQRLWDADELVPYTVVEVATPAAAAWLFAAINAAKKPQREK